MNRAEDVGVKYALEWDSGPGTLNTFGVVSSSLGELLDLARELVAEGGEFAWNNLYISHYRLGSQTGDYQSYGIFAFSDDGRARYNKPNEVWLLQ